MYEFPGEGRKAGVHVPPWNPLEGRPWPGIITYILKNPIWGTTQFVTTIATTVSFFFLLS